MSRDSAFAGDKADGGRNTCLHQQFEAQAENAPDAIAVVLGEQHLNYNELNFRANRLAHFLKKNGVMPGDRVGICVERSLEMVVGVLGILKAGATYVPVDPGHPAGRLVYIFKETDVNILVTQEKYREKIPDGIRLVICLDQKGDSFVGEDESNPRIKITGAYPAYIIYTSGSTGKPKGVQGIHGSVAIYLHHLFASYRLGKNDVFLQLPTLSFDPSIRDLLGPLTLGARVVMLNNHEAKDPVQLLEKIKSEKVTCILSIVPTMLHGLLELAKKEDMPYDSMRVLGACGEALRMSLCHKAKAVFGKNVRIINQYGPTECTMTATYHDVENPEATENIVSIGQPFPNRKVILLNEDMQPAPNGEQREIYIASPELTLGYLNRPGLTAEKFLPDPFSGQSGGRLYRTGDLAQLLPGNTLQFLGRIDHQVKIRGNRVELQEIETVLAEYPSVEKAVVVAREYLPGDVRLVGYVISKEDPPPTMWYLRRYLGNKLPDYMVPGLFVFLKEYPLSPNGKIDRKALPTPERLHAERTGIVEQPQNEIESRLKGLWEEILQIEPIGYTENFLELGGHSWLGIRLIVRIEEAFGKRLPLTILFEAPTIRELAKKLSDFSKNRKWTSIVPIQPNGSKKPFFLIHPANGSALGFYDLSRHLDPDQPFYGIQARGIDGKMEPCKSIERMARRYVKEIREVQSEGPYSIGGRCLGGIIAFEMAHEFTRQGEVVDLLAILDTQMIRNMDLGDGHVIIEENIELKNAIRKRNRKRKAKLAAMDPIQTNLKKLEKAHSKARKRYIARVYPGRLTLFRNGRENEMTIYQQQWMRLAGGGFDCQIIPGNHFTILREPHVRVLAQKIQASLDAKNSDYSGR